MRNETVTLLPAIRMVVENLDNATIPEHRKPVLEDLAGYIQSKLDGKASVNLNFICTHNSRRSQLSQVWAKVAAVSNGIRIKSFSGGTESTAFHPHAVASLLRSGFAITAEGETNPVYTVSFADDCQPLKCFSKRFDHPENQVAAFAAVMVCSDADENCPFIPGAEKRIPLQYDDPKAFDGTPEEASKYDERSLQIATEMFYVFSRIRKPANDAA
jgi:arsenate reductase